MPTTEFRVDLSKDTATSEISYMLLLVFPDLSAVYCHVPSRKVEVQHEETRSPVDLLSVLQEWGKENEKSVELLGTTF
eukprot:CAMPEP_0179122092 /NCGR_PEP_ID=MMETSP0796-20121207/57610_1 /TAXON_ID=73915 /ORGANISM="Pyrodinium bahamense, Strain pbaha01" /LENGTH=77 /DNA_ID=CAMNT_0020820709 /DNA_START=55 /DNA_END=288 /DNA_ORIENTATION=+